MMKLALSVSCVALMAVGAFAEEKAAPAAGDAAKPTLTSKEKMLRAKYRHTGGTVVKPGSLKGKMVYVNCQKAAPLDWIKSNADTFKKFTKINIEVEDGSFEFPSPKIAGNASLFIVDDEKLPSLLSAPENRWAMVNVAPLKKGEGEKPAFFAARVQKELTRGFAILAGAQDSNYPDALVGCITDAAQLDKFVDCRLPVDVMGRLPQYVPGYGVIPAQEVAYRTAVKEGWAPNPTNDVQKRIWDQIRAVPDKPIQIKYDAKRDAGK